VSHPPLSEQQGFTLLEVLIAIAILAISLSAILGSQAQSLSLATEAQFNIHAATLAKAKLAEYESGVTPLEDGDGDFGDDFPGFVWKVEVQDADLSEFLPTSADPVEPLQRLDLTVSQDNAVLSYTLRCYIKKENTR
jgi:general secretion pathway protein I